MSLLIVLSIDSCISAYTSYRQELQESIEGCQRWLAGDETAACVVRNGRKIIETIESVEHEHARLALPVRRCFNQLHEDYIPRYRALYAQVCDRVNKQKLVLDGLIHQFIAHVEQYGAAMYVKQFAQQYQETFFALIHIEPERAYQEGGYLTWYRLIRLCKKKRSDVEWQAQCTVIREYADDLQCRVLTLLERDM